MHPNKLIPVLVLSFVKSGFHSNIQTDTSVVLICMFLIHIIQIILLKVSKTLFKIVSSNLYYTWTDILGTVAVAVNNSW